MRRFILILLVSFGFQSIADAQSEWCDVVDDQNIKDYVNDCVNGDGREFNRKRAREVCKWATERSAELEEGLRELERRLASDANELDEGYKEGRRAPMLESAINESESYIAENRDTIKKFCNLSESDIIRMRNESCAGHYQTLSECGYSVPEYNPISERVAAKSGSSSSPSLTRCSCTYRDWVGDCTAKIEKQENWFAITSNTAQCSRVTWYLDGHPQTTIVTDHSERTEWLGSGEPEFQVESCKVCKDSRM